MACSQKLGYFEARRILESLYGQDHMVVSVYVNKLIEGQKMYEKDFVSKDDGLDLGAPLEDKRALQIMESSIAKVYDHCLVVLHWKSESAKFPKNRTVAEKRLGHFRNRLTWNPELRSGTKTKWRNT